MPAILARLLPTFGRAFLTLVNAVAVVALLVLWIGGHHFLLHSLAVVLAVLNAVAWPAEIVASFFGKTPAGVAIDVVTGAAKAAGPPVLDWIADVLDSLARKEIPPAEAKALAAAHLARAMEEAEAEGNPLASWLVPVGHDSTRRPSEAVT